MKILNNIAFITQSSPVTPSVGLVTVYATGSSVFYENSYGLTYSLIQSQSYIVREYTASADWVKSNNIKYIEVVAVGAGGGGGSGRVAAAGVARSGGGGGAGGSVVYSCLDILQLPSASYRVTIGTGGNSGSRVGTANASGNPGSTGGNTTFGSGSTVLVRAVGGNGGAGVLVMQQEVSLGSLVIISQIFPHLLQMGVVEERERLV